MSISSSADRLDEYEFFIRLVHKGEFTPLLWELKLGDPINIKGPRADSSCRKTVASGSWWRAGPAWRRS